MATCQQLHQPPPAMLSTNIIIAAAATHPPPSSSSSAMLHHHHQHQSSSVAKSDADSTALNHDSFGTGSPAQPHQRVDIDDTTASTTTKTTTPKPPSVVVVWQPLNDYFHSDYKLKSSGFGQIAHDSGTTTTTTTSVGDDDGRCRVSAKLSATAAVVSDNCRSPNSPTIVGMRIKGSAVDGVAMGFSEPPHQRDDTAAAVHHRCGVLGIPLSRPGDDSGSSRQPIEDGHELKSAAANSLRGGDDDASLSDLFVRKLHEMNVERVAQRLSSGGSLLLRQTASLLAEGVDGRAPRSGKWESVCMYARVCCIIQLSICASV